ncbi:MAG: AgmX/PglI C-terminal domain-containing protein [Chitinophagaceae bacterium]|nr:AgmX/PglI C-terminal domain-containing protein [Oligoflexus sp.]
MNLEIHYSPPNQSRQVVPVRDRLMIGSLLSNEVVIRAAGVEPIHAMIEVLEKGIHVLTDLGSQSGVFLNGQKVDVEAPVKIGDKITIGNVQIEVLAQATAEAAQFKDAKNDKTQAGDALALRMKKTQMAPAGRVNYGDEDDDAENADEMSDDPRSTVLADPREQDRGSDNGELLFSPRNAKPSGNVLEVVAYWEDTILDVDMFHPKIKNNERVTIGVPGKAHFLAGGTEDIKRYKLASVSKEGYTIHLRSDMSARIRKGGRVIEESGDRTIEMSRNDIAHVTHGAIKYFLMFIKPPVLELPRQSARDPVFMLISALSLVLYLGAISAIFMGKTPKKDDNDDLWSIVNTPEKKDMPKPPEKKKVEIAEVKKEPPPPVEPPKPPPKPPAPVKPEEKPKPVEVVKQPTPTPTPVKELAKVPTPTPVPPKAPTPEAKQSPKAGMAKLQDKPDMKNPGKVNPNKAQGLSGGALGGGKPNPNAGGERKGKESNDLAGVEGGAPNKAAGVNLSKLGMGVGQILNKNTAGAIKTDFKDSVGGAGGGSGSAARTTGLGGPGSGKSLGIAGTGGAANQFGGFGGNGSGAGGAGGLGGAGLGNGFGKGDGKGGQGRTQVDVPPGDPVVSGGLTNQEVQAVIRANLNQIRHCYETLLQRSPNANGKIKVNFTIGADGHVTATSINADSIGDSAMSGCVTGKIVRWAFPHPRGGQQVQVTYPFVFNPM